VLSDDLEHLISAEFDEATRRAKAYCEGMRPLRLGARRRSSAD
jgi:hypothetical protein